jgi:hypothetical protein
MTWNLFRWVWRLEAPLSIGMPPVGSLNRCRLYVPARVLWGAVTAEVSRSKDADRFPGYRKLGGEIALNCRFTYLYPAEKIDDDYLPWLPEFEQSKGLIWRRQDGRELPDREFRRHLLDARPGTAIDPLTDSASEGTLRETEFINPWWRNSPCFEEKQCPVFLLGYVFIKDSGLRRYLDDVKTLFVGGDTRYGLGKIGREQWEAVSGSLNVFYKHANLDGSDPGVYSELILGHALVGNFHGSIQGMVELLGGWNRVEGAPWESPLAWAPGSSLGEKAFWAIDGKGYWVYRE